MLVITSLHKKKIYFKNLAFILEWEVTLEEMIKAAVLLPSADKIYPHKPSFMLSNVLW